MSDIFLSYSRQDSEFVRRLHDALEKEERESWVDWDGIPPTAEWMDEIHRAIESADTFVFVISSHSIESEVCRAEVEYASRLGKRLVPIVCEHVEADAVADPLARINWIFFTDGEPFEGAFAKLVEALDTDLDHVRKHTQVLVRAQLWSRQDEDSSFLLRGRGLSEAEEWLETGDGADPLPTQLQTRYVLAGRSAESRQQRRLLSGITLALVVAIGLAILAFVQRNQAVTQGRLAVARALATQSELVLGDTSVGITVSALLAAESLKSVQTLEGVASWGRVMALLPGRPAVESAVLPGPVTSGRFSDDRELWAAGGEDGRVVVGSTTDGSVVAEWSALGSRVHSVAFSPDAAWVAVGGQQELAVWDLGSQKKVAEFTTADSLQDTFGTVRDLAFSRQGGAVTGLPGRLFVAAEAFGVEVLSTEDFRALPPLHTEESRVFSLALHPQRQALAVGGFGWTWFDLESATGRAIPDARNEEIDAMVFSSSGFELATADLALRIWDIESDEDAHVEAQPADQLLASDERIHDLTFSDSGRYLAAVWENGTTRVLDAKSGAERQRLPTQAATWRVAFSDSDDSILTIGDRFQKWTALSTEAVHHSRLDRTTKQAFFIADPARVVGISDSGWLRVFDTDGLRLQLELELGPGLTTAVSPDGRWLAAMGRKGLSVLDARSLEQRASRTFEGSGGKMHLLFAADSETLVAVGPEIAAALRLDEVSWTFLDEGSSFRRAKPEFLLGGRWLVLGGSRTTTLFDTGSWQALPTMEGSLYALSPDEARVCTHTEAVRGSRPPVVRVWQIPAGEMLAWGAESGFENYPNGKPPYEGGGERSVIDQCAQWLPLTVLEPVAPPVTTSRWEVKVAQGEVRLYARQADDMIDEACRRVPRNLTQEEWCRFFPEQRYRPSCVDLPVLGDPEHECSTVGRPEQG